MMDRIRLSAIAMAKFQGNHYNDAFDDGLFVTIWKYVTAEAKLGPGSFRRVGGISKDFSLNSESLFLLTNGRASSCLLTFVKT
jgi:hypothetical protein